MGRIALIAVALVLLTAAPDARAGFLLSFAKHGVEYAGHAGHAGQIAKELADGKKTETKGLEATGAPAEDPLLAGRQHGEPSE